VSFLDPMDDRSSIDLEKYLRSTFIKITSEDIVALMCFAPRWNSTEWKNATFTLDVSPLQVVHPGAPEK